MVGRILIPMRAVLVALAALILAAVDHDVVRVRDLRTGAERLRHRGAGDERQLGPAGHLHGRSQHHGEEERAAGRVLPHAPQAAPPFGLMVGGDRRPFRLLVADLALRRRALGQEAIGPAEASVQQWDDELGHQVRHAHLD